MHDHEKIYVAGRWVSPQEAAEPIAVYNSTTEEVMGHVPQGSAADVDVAVAAARRALPGWSASSREVRAEVLRSISAGLKARSDEIVEIVCQEVGMPKEAARMLQVGLPRASFSNAAKIVSSYEFEYDVGSSLIIREPVGVVGAITPWNYPLHQLALKAAPALAAGNTLVVKPSEVAPVSTFVLTEIIAGSGLPPGAFNLVTGYGVPVGEAIAGHPGIDMVSFTGSTTAGKRVAELASGTVKRVALELGGKSANIILDDADFEEAVSGGLTRLLRNSGQTCTALSRMLVPRHRLSEVEELALLAMKGYTLGDPLQDGTTLGPLVSERQRERVRNYIRRGIAEGARLITGGAEPPESLSRGYFVQPTIFSDVTNDMTIARDEIFGPVLSIIAYDDEDEAVAIANDSPYGLSGAVYSGSQEHAEAVARRIRAGQVEINGGAFNVWAPFGGYKQSGLGREGGRFGFEEYLEVKSLQR
jgi:acyl-CoA reductase-like NAD-dependent aldehyde dehydrogenase